MTAVHYTGTFSKDERPLNGLEPYAAEIVKEIEADDCSDWIVVATLTPHTFAKKPGEASTPAMRIVNIECVSDDDAAAVRALIVKYRKARGGEQPDLFDADGWAKDGDDD